MTIPAHILRALQDIADAEGLTVPDLLRRWVPEELADMRVVTVRGWRVAT